MRKLIALWIPTLLLVFGLPGRAQDQKKSSKTEKNSAQAPTTDTQKLNMKEYVELLRTDVRHQKAQLMGAMMALNAEDAAKFWPIYSEYDAALAKVNDLRVANIQEYAKNYKDLTPEKADELIQKSWQFQKERGELLAQYYGRMKDVLGAVTAARFAQIEHQLLLIVDLQIVSSLPLAQESS
jgi:hypothetical protein